MVLSEFGRTFKENGNKGTDHGHGSVYWVLGGSVNGGRIAGDQAAFKPELLDEGRDLRVLTDYRSLIAELVARSYGLGAPSLDRIFPDTRPSRLALI